MRNFVVKGNICYSGSDNALCTVENGYIVCEDKLCVGVFENLPECYETFPCYDYADKLIIPGLIDLHVHAPQYPFRGLGLDLAAADWLDTHIFAEESKYADLEYAEKAYTYFVSDLLTCATTRACVWGTAHTEATLLLMQKLEDAGLKAYVGKLSTGADTAATEQWLRDCGRFKNIKPILTTGADSLPEGLSGLRKVHDLHAQAHVFDHPDASGLDAAHCPDIMAHCVHCSDDELAAMRRQKVFIAHCPESNANLSLGVAPVRKYLEQGMKVGLGSDVAAGSSLSIFRAMAMAIQCSKLRWSLYDQSAAPLTMDEAFYLATKGGGEFFGKVGSFEKGYEFDAVVIDDASHRHPQKLSVRERLERLIYLAESRNIVAKFVDAKLIREKKDCGFSCSI